MLKIYLVVMLLGNPTHTTWTQMPSMEVCQAKKSVVYQTAIKRNQSVLISCEVRKK